MILVILANDLTEIGTVHRFSNFKRLSALFSTQFAKDGAVSFVARNDGHLNIWLTKPMADEDGNSDTTEYLGVAIFHEEVPISDYSFNT